MTEKMTVLLEQYDYAALHVMASYQGLKLQGKGSKPELIHMLNELAQEPAQLAKNLTQLATAGHTILHLLQRQGGKATLGAIRRRLRDLKLVEAQDSRTEAYSNQKPNYKNPNSRYLDELLANLQAAGLVLGRPVVDAYGRSGNLTLRLVDEYEIPAGVLVQLPPPPELPAHLPPIKTPARVLESSARTFQRDLYLYWSYVHHSQPELIAKGLLAKRHLTALNESLLQREAITTGQGEANFPRLVFLRSILHQLGLLAVDEAHLAAKPGGEAFLAAEPLERIRKTFEAYTANRQLNEIALVSSVSVQGTTRLLPAPDRLVDARRAVCLHFHLAEDWTSLAALIERIRQVDYEFLLPRTYNARNSSGYYYSYGQSPYSADHNPLGWEWDFYTRDEGEGWQRVEAEMIAWTVSGPLFWMGLVDLGYSEPDAKTPDAFRLTALGRWLLAGGPPPEIPLAGGQVIVQPDFTILAFDPINDGVLFNLEKFAQRVSAERAILFRLTQSAVYAAQQGGWDAARIQAYLEELSHQPMPGNVARTLVEWQAAHERIRVYTKVNLLHAAQPADLDELARSPQAAALLQHTLAPGVALLPPGQKIQEAAALLAQLGWRPTVTRKAASLPPNSVRLDAAGLLTPVARSLGLYLRAHLARFAEEDGPAYRLTPAAVRRAVAAGLTAPQVVEELNRVLVTAVTPELEARILAWSGHFGQVQAEPTTLLRFKNRGALEQLLRDPQVSGLLRSLRPSDLPEIALVRPRDLEKLRRLLEERGVEWKE